MDIDKIEFVRGLKGAPASIVLALVFCGGALTNADLEQMTGYSDKPIAKGLALLELKGLVQYNGFQYGWSLTAGVRQLHLFPLSMLDSGGDQSRRISDSDSERSRKYSDSDETATGESRKFSDSYTTTTTKNSSEEELVVVGSETARGSRRISDSGDDPVEAWLIRGGIGQNSPKMRRLLEQDFDPEYVKAHVLERLATIARPDGGWFQTGMLIRKLMDGDAAPPMRCEECLEYESRCRCGNGLRSQIPDRYKDIIKR